MRASGLNHVSVHVVDMAESLRFYTEVFGMERVPSPDFGHPVEWLTHGDQQFHLFARDDSTVAPAFHHVGLDVEDLEAVYRRAVARGLSPSLRELPGGEVQMYLRDPAGNLVEVDWPDASSLDRSVVGEIPKLEDERPQSEEARRARLYTGAEGKSAGSS